MIPEAFRVAHYRFDLEAIDPLHLPAYQGSTFRGGFGHAFKKMVCSQADWRDCTPCALRNDCPYGYIFETTAPEASQLFSGMHEVPVPFVIEVPAEGQREYRPGEPLAFGVVLIGRAIDYLPYFLLAFQELGRIGIGKPHGRYILQRITATHPWRTAHELVFDGVDVRANGSATLVTAADVAERAAALPTNRLTVSFLTPTRIKHQDRIVDQPDFHVLVRALLRRISSLSYFHCGVVWNEDFRGLIAAAERVELASGAARWIDWDRFSGRQQQRINLGGFVGEATYQGDLDVFRPLLALGELVHVGKAAVFGNGRYQVRARGDGGSDKVTSDE